MKLALLAALFAAALVPVGGGASAKPVTQIDIYVTPIYAAAPTVKKRRVAVDKRFDAALKSDDPAAIRAVHEALLANGRTASPLLLMVLSARLYDIGARDDAVFWHYAAKERYFLMADVLEGYQRGGMASANAEFVSAIGAFVSLAGPVINGYAFCDFDRQIALRQKAFDWVAAQPWDLLRDPRQTARGEDREALIAAALAENGANVTREAEYLSDPANREQIIAARRDNNADAQFCF